MTTVKWDESMAIRCLARCRFTETEPYIPATTNLQSEPGAYTADEAYAAEETDAAMDTADIGFEEFETGAAGKPAGRQEDTGGWDVFTKSIEETSEWDKFAKSIEEALTNTLESSDVQPPEAET